MPDRQPRSKRALNIPHAVLCVAIGLLGIGVFYRTTFLSRGDLIPGTEIDSRFIIFILEHWHRVVTGRESWSTLGAFYPASGVLGLSESLFLFAAPYVPMRLLGMDPFSAFRNTLILVSALAYGGAAFFLRRILRLHVLPAFAMAAVFAFSSHLFMTMFHPQMLAVALVPFLAMVLWRAISLADTPTPARWKYAAAFPLLFAFTAMSAAHVAWACAFWLAIAAGVAFVLFVARDGLGGTLRTVIPWIRGKARLLLVMAGSTVVAALPVWVVYGNLGRSRTATPWPLIQATLGRDFVGFTGLTLVMTFGVAVIWALVCFFRRSAGGVVPGAVIFSAVGGLSAIILVLLALEYPSEFQPWMLVYWHVPAGKLFRVVFRVFPIAMFAICSISGILLSRALDTRIKALDGHMVTEGGVVLLLALAMVSQVRESSLHFSIEQQRARFAAVPMPPKECKSFYSHTLSPDFTAYVTADIDSMLISQLVGIPTLDGYSAEAPNGWGLRTGTDREARVREWIQRNHLDGVCVYDPAERRWALSGIR